MRYEGCQNIYLWYQIWGPKMSIFKAPYRFIEYERHSEEEVYIGEVRKGTNTAHGRGICIEDNGSVWVGNFRDGQLHGWIRLVHPYEGATLRTDRKCEYNDCNGKFNWRLDSGYHGDGTCVHWESHGEIHGTTPDGKKYLEIWENGKMVKREGLEE
jgi:hypothetical protein